MANGRPSLAAGDARRERGSNSGEQGNLDNHGCTGHVLYRQELVFRPGYGSDRLTLYRSVFGGEPKVAAGAIIPLPVYNPIRNTLWAKVTFFNGVVQKDQVRWTSRWGAAEREPFVTYPMSAKVQGWVTLSCMQAAGVGSRGYRSNGERVGQADGKLLRGARFVHPIDHKKDLPWIDTKIGVTDKCWRRGLRSRRRRQDRP